ncbi:MAG: DUF5689 domain-containing protein [Rikenellaceae bacterium]|nr:DUF5689 domain-containing protein [Rikenellaceae bacterium]
MRKIIYIIVVFIIAGCSSDSYTGYSENDFRTGTKSNISIDSVKYYYRDGGGVTTFTSQYNDYIISGTVTANDRSGNFYRVFMLEDHSGAIEIKAGLYDLYSLFPVGRKVFVKITGLTLGQEDGMYQLGLQPTYGSSYETEYISSALLVDKHIIRDIYTGVPVSEETRISDLTDDHIGRLMKIDGLKLDNGGEETWAYSSNETYNGLPGEKDIKARDINGDSIYVYTSGYADFALDKTPSGDISITGIIMKRGRSYRIKFRNEYDIETN